MSAATPAVHGTAGQTVRRFVVVVLLFTLVTIAASGLSGLLGRLLDAGSVIADGDTTGLATSLAFTLVAGPLAALLWWFEWRGLGSPVERGSTLWGLYLAGMSTLALILMTVFLLSTISTLIDGDWDPHQLSAGLVWLGVWLWHRWMSQHRSKAPTRLTGAARTLGYAFGLVVATVASIQTIGTLVDLAVAPPAVVALGEHRWWTPVLQSAVWAVGGAVVWWLHWVLDRGSQLRTAFSAVMLVLATGVLAVGLSVAGSATVLFVVLRIIFESAEPFGELVEPLGTALAAACIGAVIWAYYRTQVAAASAPARLGAHLVSAGVGLGAAASGVGIIVNSILGAIVAPLAESGSRSLLFAGISLLVVGGPVWWAIWKPSSPATVERSRETGRRVYLVTVFGISALVAIITLLVIGYQVFEFALSGELDASLLDRIRASLGLLIATGLVAAYHFSVWRGDRSLLPAEGARAQTIDRVVLVTGGDPEPAVRAIRDATGAAVTVWIRTDDEATGTPAGLAAALDGVTGARVLVLVGADGVQVVPLEG